jgi:hypothetical protein
MADPLLERIERLEKQNSRMKTAMSALCFCLGALLVMAQTIPRKTEDGRQRIEAREIVLNDGGMKARLTPDSLAFGRTSGREVEKTTITASGISLSNRYAMEIKPAGLMCIRDGVTRLDLNVGEIGAALAFKNASGATGTMLDESTLVLLNGNGILSLRPEHIFLQKGEADAFLTPTSLRIRDAERHKAVLGQADRASSSTGEKQTRHAASLTLLDKDDGVLWQSP